MKKITRKWVKLAEYDFASAKIMLDSGRYLYVSFMCQQAIEKYIKAYITELTDEMPPYTHNLTALFELSKIEFTEDQFIHAQVLTRYYLNARYPNIKDKLSEGLNKSVAKNLYRETEELIKCLRKKLKM